MLPSVYSKNDGRALSFTTVRWSVLKIRPSQNSLNVWANSYRDNVSRTSRVTELTIAPGQEAKEDTLGTSFLSSKKIY